MRTFERLALAVLLLTVSGCSSNDKDPVTGITVIGSGNLAQQNRAVSGFTGLVHASIGDVHVTLGAAEALTIQAEDNLLEHLETVVQGGRLRIRTESGVDLQPTLGIEFHLTVTSLDLVALVGAGEIDALDLNSDQVAVILGGAGRIEILALDATDLEATLSGVGDIVLAGQATQQSVLISGTGKYEAESLQSTHADVTISGFGDATVAVTGTLDATISGIGSIYYVGNPVVTSVITGTGTVEPL